MYAILFENRFKKDYKLAEKRGLKIELLEEVLLTLRENGSLPSKFKRLN
jgi:mRNA interferase YafQ